MSIIIPFSIDDIFSIKIFLGNDLSQAYIELYHLF